MKRFSLLAVSVSLLLFSTCAKSPAELAEKHTRRGDDHVQQEKYREATIEYMNAVKAKPDDAGLMWKLAETALKAKDFKTAFGALQKVVELDPDNYEARGMLGEIYLASGKVGESAKIADDFVLNRPEDPKGYFLQSGIAARGGDLDGATEKMKRAVDLDPDNAKLLVAMGNLYLLKRDAKNAMLWYDRALVKDPDSPEIHLAKGSLFFATGKSEKGEKEYRKAIELSDDKEKIRINLARIYLYQGKVEDGEKELTSLIEEENSLVARKVLAEVKIETGRVDGAKEIIAEIQKENENDLDGKYLEGRIALSENRLKGAKILFGEVIKRDAAMAPARLYNGLTEVRLGNIEVGKAEIKEAVKLNPGYSRAHLALGDVYLQTNSPALAEKEALEVLRRNPANFKAFVMYGDSFFLRKDWEKAEQVYKAIIKQAPENPLGYMKMGISKKMQMKRKETIDYFSLALQKNPYDLNVVNEYIFALEGAGKNDMAIGILDEYLQKSPDNPILWEMRGRLYLAMSNTKEAEEALMKTIELAPDFSRAYNSLGVLYVSQRRLPEAEEKFRRLVDMNSTNVGAITMLGMALNSQGKIEEANEYYRKALDLSPRHGLAANNLASNLTDYGGNLDEALKFAQIAREVAPDDPSIADTLGWIYYRKGFIDRAFHLIEDAAGKMKKNPVVRYHYGVILAEKGKMNEAKAELTAALEINQNFPGEENARLILKSLK